MSATDWQTCKDPTSGRAYYFNAKTNTTTWTLPPELSAAAPAAGAAAAAGASPWVKHYDATSKNYYYFNSTTQQTSWTDPSNGQAQIGASAAAAMAAAAAAAKTTPPSNAATAPAVVASAPGTPTTSAPTTPTARAPVVAPGSTPGVRATPGHKVPPPLPGTTPKAAVVAPGSTGGVKPPPLPPSAPAATAAKPTPAAATPAAASTPVVAPSSTPGVRATPTKVGGPVEISRGKSASLVNAPPPVSYGALAPLPTIAGGANAISPVAAAPVVAPIAVAPLTSKFLPTTQAVGLAPLPAGLPNLPALPAGLPNLPILLPPGTPKSSTTPPPPTANDLYDRFHHAASNTYYYVNKQTQASQWDMPAGWVDKSATASGSATSTPSSTGSGVRTLSGLKGLTVQPVAASPAAGGSLAPKRAATLAAGNSQFHSLPGPLQPGVFGTGNVTPTSGASVGSGTFSTPQAPHPMNQPALAPFDAASPGTSTPSSPYPMAATQTYQSPPGSTGGIRPFMPVLPPVTASGVGPNPNSLFKPVRVEDNVIRMDQKATHRSASVSFTTAGAFQSAASGGPSVNPLTAATIAIDAKTGRPAGLPTPLRGDILKFSLQGFASEHFRSAKKAQSKKAIPVEQELSWQKDPIKKSLLAAAKNYDSACVKLFTSIQAFMLDAGGKRNAMALLDTIVTQGVQKPPLRDEIFCQITKQTRNNPNPASTAEGWKLFALCLSAFPPTREFQNYLVNYFIDNYDSAVDEVRVLAPFCYFRIHKTVKEGPEPMKQGEVDAICKAGGPKSATVTWGGNVAYIIALQKAEGLSLDVPLILHSLIDTIKRQNGFNTKGVFRLAAEGSLVKAAVAQCKAATGANGAAAYEMKHNDCLVTADVLKIWLRELAEPIFPTHLYDECIRSSDNPALIASIIGRLPKPQYDTIDFLLNFFCDLANTEPATAMGTENISVVFSPNLLRTAETDPNILFKNEGKVRSFVKNAIIAWQKIKTGTLPKP